MGERERWMTAVQGRLDRVASTRDLGLALEDGALEEAGELERILTGDAGDLPARYLLGWLRWRRYQARPDDQDLRAAVEMLTPCFADGMDGLPEPLVPILADHAALTATRLLELAQRSTDQASLLAVVGLWRRIVAATPVDHPGRAGRQSNLGSALQARFRRTGAADDLDAAITCFREVVDVAAEDYPPRAAILSNLGSLLLARFERTGAVTDLDAAVEAGQKAVQATPAADPNRAAILSNLSDALRIRFGTGGAAADLDGAVEAGREAVRATPAGHSDRAGYLSNLGTALKTRFNLTGGLADLSAAVEVAQEAVRATPGTDPRRVAYLSNLGITLLSRFERTGTAADLDAAVTFAREAADAAGEADPHRATVLSNLGNALRVRFGRTGAMADLEGAVEASAQAVQTTPAGHPDRARYLSNLGNALLTRFERTGATSDGDAAIEAGQQAVQAIPAGRPGRAAYLANLGTALQARFRRTGVLGDVDSAITFFGEAVRATPAGHPDRPVYLSNLGNTQRMRFERTGAAADLDSAITRLREAVQTAPGDHPDRAAYLANLAGALRARFACTGAMADLDAAVEAGQQAVNAAAADYPHRALHLSNLGNALLSRFGRTGRTTDLDAAIASSRAAVQATPADHPDHAIYLSNLGTMLWVQFERSQGTADLNSAVTCLREALRAIPADQPHRAQILSNLGTALTARFGRTEEMADLDAAVEAGRQATQAAPAGHPDRAVILSNLGDALQARFERTGMAADRDAALQMYQEAAAVAGAPASARIAACRNGASLAAQADPERAAGLLEAAVLLLPLVTPRFLERGDQQYAIGRFAGLAADAAALALSDPAMPEPQRPAQALRLLEAARGVLLSQALSTRGDLSELREHHQELADRFIELRDLLDRHPPISEPGLAGVPGDTTATAMQRTAAERRQADAEFTQLLTRIRGLEGFSTFALPPSAEQLEAQAAEGPVVVFNVSAYRSDAILLTRDGITSRNLPGLDQATVIQQVAAFRQALDTMTSAGSPLEWRHAQQAMSQVLAWLWDNAAGPVLHDLGHLEPPPPGKPWPRLWWVPTGLLSLLPIHAAGYHASPPDPTHRAAIDRVISSYTPTIGALAHARLTPPAAVTSANRSLIVAMPTTPGLSKQGRLSYVPDEVALVRARLPHPTVLTEPGTAGTPGGHIPTKATVLENLANCTIAHFACHGHTDPADPSRSHLLLHDHRHDPLTVAALAPLDLKNARLAYLSACGTARMTTTRLLDEAIHLASAFQLAGFPHVIGTLWEINDKVAANVADAFYAALTDPDGTIAPRQAASALHHAARTQRDRRPATPYLWASHIHAGA
jgi:tetratricopeptide (TPR) repeat protein